MSTFLGLIGTGSACPFRIIQVGLNINDDSVQPADYRTTLPQSAEGNALYSDVLWPRSSFPGQITGACNGFAGLDSAHQQWEWNLPPTGNHTGKKITGIVRDSNGVAVSGATVWLFNTSTGLLVDTQTTAADGSYTCNDPNAVACFAVGYLTGSPDTAGVTVDTITGT